MDSEKSKKTTSHLKYFLSISVVVKFNGVESP